MTCPSLLRRYPAVAGFLGELSRGPLAPLWALAGRAAERIRRDDVLAQFVRFVLVGALSTAAYAVLFITLHGLGYLPANIGATVVSSVMANELHRRLTFRAEERMPLSPQELQIAQLAAEGLSNREIGQRLYLSHRTIGSHLYRTFPKLGITSRSQVRDALAIAAGRDT